MWYVLAGKMVSMLHRQRLLSPTTKNQPFKKIEKETGKIFRRIAENVYPPVDDKCYVKVINYYKTNYQKRFGKFPDPIDFT
jgi:hypothetical protein